MINWPDEIYVALLTSLPISSTVRHFQAICKIMVCNYTETKMLAPYAVYQTLVRPVQKPRNGVCEDVGDSRDGSRAHSRAATGAVSWRQYALFAVLRAEARGSYVRCNDCMPLLRAFLRRAEVFFFGRPDERTVCSSLPLGAGSDVAEMHAEHVTAAETSV